MIVIDSVPQNFGSHQTLPSERIFFACPQVLTVQMLPRYILRNNNFANCRLECQLVYLLTPQKHTKNDFCGNFLCSMVVVRWYVCQLAELPGAWNEGQGHDGKNG